MKKQTNFFQFLKFQKRFHFRRSLLLCNLKSFLLMAEASVPFAHRIPSFSALDAVGKHRLLAELKRLDQEARFLEEGLEQLAKLEKASASCKELLGSVEMRSDPVLPETLGPVNPGWDRWFEGPKDSNRCRCRCRCWIL